MRRRWDLPFGRMNLLRHHPNWVRSTGFLLLRRYTGSQFPRPAAAPIVGFAARPASSVDSDSGATYANETVYWHVVDRVSVNGVLHQQDADQAHCAAYDSNGYVGAIPNTPIVARLIPVGDGTRVRLQWLYNPVDQQAAPERFDIFHNSGSGDIDWGTVQESIDYIDGREWYSWRSGSFSPGDSVKVSVRARTASGVYSLVPRVADNFIGGHPNYDIPAGSYDDGLVHEIEAISLTAPEAPQW